MAGSSTSNLEMSRMNSSPPVASGMRTRRNYGAGAGGGAGNSAFAAAVTPASSSAIA